MEPQKTQQNTTQQQTQSQPFDTNLVKPKRKTPLVIGLVLLFLLMAGGLGYLGYQNYNLKKEILNLQFSTESTSATSSTENNYINQKFNFSLKIPGSWDGYYLTSNKEQDVSFDFIGKLTNYLLFSINKVSLQEWDNLQKEVRFRSFRKELKRDKNNVYYSAHSIDNPYINKEGDKYQSMAADINNILSTFKFTDQTNPTANWKTYVGNNFDYSIKHPNDWTIYSPTPDRDYQGNIMFVSPSKQNNLHLTEIYNRDGLDFQEHIESFNSWSWEDKKTQFINIGPNNLKTFWMIGTENGKPQEVWLIEGKKYFYSFRTLLDYNPKITKQIISSFHEL